MGQEDEGSRRKESTTGWGGFVAHGAYTADGWEHAPNLFGRVWKPACDLFETERHYVVVVELAGVSPPEVEVVHQGQQLTVKGRRGDVTTFPKKGFYQMEIYFGPFYREIELPGEIDQDSIKAYFQNGFLVMECPKKETGTEKRIHIE